MTVACWIVAALVAAVYASGGVKKLVQTPDQLRPMMGWVDVMPLSYLRAIGAIELLGAIGLILPPLTRIAPGLAIAAAIGLAIVQVGAFALHFSRHEISDELVQSLSTASWTAAQMRLNSSWASPSRTVPTASLMT